MEEIIKYLKERFAIRSQMEDFNIIHQEIEKGISFKGTNLWILIFAIVVASVGLNMNSTAVIIGAMLISPLMGPINGMGYSLATYDFPLLKLSVKNFSFAVGASLVASSLYFIISPINEAHSELLARTTPTIYDVIIALFGGLAGIIAISSKLKGNVIPGVAIATALMPPICTAGYGIATLQFNFVFGALYLFTINTVFIALASLLGCQYLKFPYRSIIDPLKKKKVRSFISLIIFVTAVPSIYFGYRLVVNEKFVQSARMFIRDVSTIDGNYLQNDKINSNQHTIDLVYSGYGLSSSNMEQIKKIAIIHHLDTSKVSINQSFNAAEIQENTRQYMSEKEILNNKLTAAIYNLQQAENKIDSLKNIPMFGNKILSEISSIYPQIIKCAYTETYFFKTRDEKHNTHPQKIPVVVIYTDQKQLSDIDKSNITNWLKKRLETDNVVSIFQ